MNLNCDQPKTKTQDPKEDRIERREAKNVNIFLPELFHVFPILIWSIYILFGIFKLVTFFGHISHWPIRPKDHSSGYLSVSHSFIPVPGLFPCLSVCVCVCLWVRVKWLKWIQPRLSYEGAAVGKLPHTYGKIWYPIFFEIPRRFCQAPPSKILFSLSPLKWNLDWFQNKGYLMFCCWCLIQVQLFVCSI